MPLVISTLIWSLCSFSLMHSIPHHLRYYYNTFFLSVSPLPVVLRLWGSCTSSPMICLYKLSLCRHAWTSQRWSRRSWAFMCPRSSQAWSSPSSSTAQTEDLSLWISWLSVELWWPVILLFLVKLQKGRESFWFYELNMFKLTFSSRMMVEHGETLTGQLGRSIQHSYACYCVCFLIACYLYNTQPIFLEQNTF